MKRIGLFILTNILVLIVFSIFWNVANYFYPLDQAYGSYYLPLLVFFGIWGMAGAFVSLYMSKWVAKKYYKVQMISEDSMDPVHRNLMQSVHSIAASALYVPVGQVSQSSSCLYVPATQSQPSPHVSGMVLGSTQDTRSLSGARGCAQVAHPTAPVSSA